MATFSERLKSLRQEKGWSQQRLADELKLSKSSVNMYERGEREPGFETMETIADLFNVDMNYLYGHTDIKIADPIVRSKRPASPLALIGERYIPKGQIPLLGRVAAGLPMYADDNIECYIASDFADGETYYGLRVQGDSMSAAGIDDGDVVIVRQQDSVDADQIAVVLVNGNDATIKYVQQQGNIVFLSPKSYNPAHQIQVYDISKTPIQIIGRVVQCRKNL